MRVKVSDEQAVRLAAGQRSRKARASKRAGA